MVGAGSEAARCWSSPCGLKVFACLVLRSLFFPTLFSESHAATPCNGSKVVERGDIVNVRGPRPPFSSFPLVSSCLSPKPKAQHRRNDGLTPTPRATPYTLEVDLSSL